MKQHNSAYFRRNMSKVFTECEESSEPVAVVTNKGKDVFQQMVIISKAQYDLMIKDENK